MNQKIIRFYVACLALGLFFSGAVDFIRHFVATDLLPTEQTRGFLISALSNLLMGITFAGTAWRAHRKVRSGENNDLPSFYPRAEAAIYALAGLMLFAGFSFLGSSYLRTWPGLDLWEQAQGIMVMGLLAVAGVGSFVITTLLLRGARNVKLKPGHYPPETRTL